MADDHKLCGEGENVAISYNKLWKLLIDKNMKKMDLRNAAGIYQAARRNNAAVLRTIFWNREYSA